MNAENLDKTLLKSLIHEIIREDISLFKAVIKEILIENQIIVSDEQQQKRKRLERLIDEDFEKYDEVFKVLA